MQRHGAWTLTALLALPACGEESAAGGPPAAWSVRLDEPEEKHESSRLVESEGGLDVKPGPTGVLWRPGQEVTGTYRLAADVTHLDSGLHPHGAGLAFGGTDVEGENQTYTYFLVRGDGEFLIKLRKGTRTPVVIPWKRHEAVSAEDQDGVTHNRLSVEVGAEETVFSVNGTEVHRAPTASLPTDGLYGFRLVHDLHVCFGKLELEPVDE